MLKITRFQSIAISSDGIPSMRDAAAVRHVGEHVVQRGRVAGHLEPDVEALRHAELALRVGDRCRG